MKIKLIAFFIILVLALPGISHLFAPGFFPMHDDTQVARTAQMAKALGEGQFPVRWVSELGYGYGYPIFNFYNPLPYYISAFFVLLGLDVLMATKIMIVFGFLLSGISMFLLSHRLFGSVGGILSALLYVYAPYHAVQLYVRGSIAELWAYAILPLVVWGIVKKDKILGGIALALLILSHNLTIIMVLPIIIVLMLMLILTGKNKPFLLHCYFITLLIGFSLSAFFWLPALVENQYTAVNQMVDEKFNPLLHFVEPWQLWYSPWGYAGSAPPGEIDGMSFQLGKPNLILAAGAILMMILAFKNQQKNLTLVLAFAAFWLLSIFLLLPISTSLWQILLPAMKYLQFPWRFLSLVNFFGSLTAGYLIYIFMKTCRRKILVYLSLFFLIFATFYLNLKYFRPQYLYKAESQDFLTEEKLRWQASRISDEYLPLGFPVPQTQNEIPSEKLLLQLPGEIKVLKESSTDYQFEVKTPADNFLTLNVADFPGWQIWLDKRLIPGEDKYLVKFKIPPGNHPGQVKFTNTPVRTIGNIISLIGLIFLFCHASWRTSLRAGGRFHFL